MPAPIGAFDHSWRPRAEAHTALRAIGHQFVEGDGAAHAGHRPHEIFDHAVGLGMIDVEAGQFAVADKIDAGLLLDVDHDARRVESTPVPTAMPDSQSGIGYEPTTVVLMRDAEAIARSL